MTSTVTPRSASPVAAARPAIPAPTTTAVRRDDSAAALRRPVWRGKGAATAVGGHRGASPRNVCTMLVSQPGIVSLRTAVKPASRKPLPESRCAVECQHAAPQIPVQRRVAGLPPAGGNDDAPAHRVPDRGRGRESRTEYSCTASVAPGASRLRRARSWVSRIGEIADQIGGQDAVERADDAAVGEVFDGGVHEPHR